MAAPRGNWGCMADCEEKPWWKEGALDPPGGSVARRSSLRTPGIVPHSRQGRDARRGKQGRESRSSAFHHVKLKRHVPIMKYFLPFHGSSVIPDGSEPGKTDPHPPPFAPTHGALTARAGPTQGLRSARPGCFPTFQHPPNAAFLPLFPILQPGISTFPGVFQCRSFPLPPPCPQGCHPRREPPLSFTLELCGFSSSSKFN